MSPKAIHNLIEIFGVEQGIHILNLFTISEEIKPLKTPETKNKFTKPFIAETNLSQEIITQENRTEPIIPIS